jgi:hypothetical protein
MAKAIITFDDTEVPCVVNTLSKIGACLLVETTRGIPEVIEFIGPNQAPKTCKVVWRDDTRLGVHFRK